MDSLFEELVSVDSTAALKFFVENLQETAGAQKLREDETLYVASILAHYAQTSRADTLSIPSMANLAEVFDSFILHTPGLADSEILEIGGSQILLFAGFFRDQMRRRHNVEWYDHLGQSMYERASHYASDTKKRVLLDRISESFPFWTIRCRDVSRLCRENHFLLRLN
ncbi:MAG TPA: hypothetical protein VHA14_03360 [Bryobacteraceae bacterium]|nr:hypothetical protein [Bryobacteraceae bacterium]